MSKICPNCKEVYDDEEFICGSCGVNLVEMTEKTNPTLHLGDANAISGGVSINQSKNITSHDTHYHSTTVQERSKSESELKLDANNQLRAKAEEIMAERRRIDSLAMSQLRPLALQLGIDDETFKSIIKDVRSNRNGGSSGLSAANARYLQQAQQAVKTNDMDTLSNLTPRLEAMAAISQDDNVQYLFYLTLSLFYPLKCMEVYERQTDENYWRTFWAVISYIRTGKYAEATSLLALFDPLRYEKSEDDQNLLEAYFNMMKDDKDGAQEFLDEILGEPSEQVKPLHRAIETTLYEEDADSLEVRFYKERVMTKADVVVRSQKNVEPITMEETSSRPDTQTQSSIASEKNNKEADELYAKASAASDAKRVMLLQKAADAGSLEAMFDLADCYDDGEGVLKNPSMAMKWLTKAADDGYAKAQLALGAMYLTGDSERMIDQNYSLSEKYLLMAAEKDNADAQGFLSMLYIDMEEYDKALIWARKASQLNQPWALYSLGRIYDEGLGVETNHLEGLKWFERAAEAGYADAQNVCGNIYVNADFVEHNPEKSFKYYQMAAAQGHGYGMLNLGTCYMNGDGTAKNLALGEEWIRKAADVGVEEAIDFVKEVFDNTMEEDGSDDEMETALDAYNNGDYESAFEIWSKWADLGDSDAMYDLGVCYVNGQGVPQDYAEAVKWYRKAADLGNADAMTNLGLCYDNGQGVSQDYAEAVKWYRKAADLGNAEACRNLAVFYELGQGVTQDDVEAVKWYRKAADLGNADAMTNLGLCYVYGQGVSQDYVEAVKWYRKAAELGDIWAMSEIAELFSEMGKNEEAKEWAQKALDNGYEEMDGEMEKILENTSLNPEVVFEKAWVTQENEQTIGVHWSLHIENQRGKVVSFKCVTRSLSPGSTFDKSTDVIHVHKEKSNALNWDDTRWDDWRYFLNETDIKSKLRFEDYPFELQTELFAYDSLNNCLGSYSIRYKVVYELRVFKNNKLLLANN